MGYYLIYDDNYKIISLSSQKQSKSVFINNINNMKINHTSYYDIESNVIMTDGKTYNINKVDSSDLDVDLV